MDPKIIWFIAGFALMLAEFIVPGLILVFFGFGALVVSFLMWIGWVETLPAQSITFALSSLLLLFTLRRYMTAWFVGSSTQGSSDIEEEFIGKKAIVVKAIAGGMVTGKVECKGAQWVARSETPIPQGGTATIVARDGLQLVVRPAD